MSKWIDIGRAGMIDADRVIAIAKIHSEPIKRLIEATDPQALLNLTFGEPRESILIFENGLVVILSLSTQELKARII